NPELILCDIKDAEDSSVHAFAYKPKAVLSDGRAMLDFLQKDLYVFRIDRAVCGVVSVNPQVMLAYGPGFLIKFDFYSIHVVLDDSRFRGSTSAPVTASSSGAPALFRGVVHCQSVALTAGAEVGCRIVAKRKVEGSLATEGSLIENRTVIDVD